MSKNKPSAPEIQELMLEVNDKVGRGDKLSDYEARLRQYHCQYGLEVGSQKFIENEMADEPVGPDQPDSDDRDNNQIPETE